MYIDIINFIWIYVSTLKGSYANKVMITYFVYIENDKICWYLFNKGPMFFCKLENLQIAIRK